LINKKKSFYEIITFEGNERDRSPLLPYFNTKPFLLVLLVLLLAFGLVKVLKRAFEIGFKRETRGTARYS